MTQDSEPSATGSGSAAAPRPAEDPIAVPAALTPRWAWGYFAILFLVHLLDSMDRWLLPAVVGPVREEFELSDTQAGWLATVLLLSFAAWSPVVGYLADRFSRPRLIAVGIAVWSLATVATALSRTYDQLVAARILVGIGGATFIVISLTLLMDLFPRGVRARIFSAYYLAMPAGAALGLGVGAALARAFDWHAAFLVAGTPGLLLAILALSLPDPVRGASEGVEEQRLRLHERVGPSREDYVDLMVNSSYTYSVFALAFSMFAIAGLVYWLPTFLTVVHEIPPAQASTWLTLTIPAAMTIGMAAGGWLGDRYSRVNPRALFLVPGLAMLVAIPFVLLAIFGKAPLAIAVGVFAAIALIFMNAGPCNAIIAGVVMPNMRAVACAVALAATHLLGDIWSPTLMGWIADTFGQPDSMATPFGEALAAIGAVPRALEGRDPENLSAALLSAIPALAVAGCVLLAGTRHLPRELALMQAKLRAAPTRGAGASASARPTPRRPSEPRERPDPLPRSPD